MSSHVQHHYIPKFLLEEWVGADRRLTAFRWAAGTLISSRCSPKAVAKVQHLYTRSRRSSKPDVSLEKHYFGPKIDERAAPVHRALLHGDVGSLTQQQRVDWSRFLLAQMARVPEMMSFLREAGRRSMLEHFQEMANNAGMPQATDVWGDQRHADTLDDEGLNILEMFIESKELNKVVLEAHWTVLAARNRRVDALLSDNPLANVGGLDRDDFLLILPIAPYRLFVCTKQKEDLARAIAKGRTSFYRATNKQLVKQASDYVFARDRFHEPLVRKHLSALPREAQESLTQ